MKCKFSLSLHPITTLTHGSHRGILHSGATQLAWSSENTTQYRALQNCKSRKALWLMKAWSGGSQWLLGASTKNPPCDLCCLQGLSAYLVYERPTRASVRHCNLSVTDVQMSSSATSLLLSPSKIISKICSTFPGPLNNKQSSYRIL